jgi:hypothetical protein
MKMSVRSLQRRLKQFRDEPSDEITDGEAGDDADSQDDSPAPVVYESPKELLTKRLNQIKKVLSEGFAPVDADPLRNGENRISDALELVEVTKLAIDEGLLGGDAPLAALPAPPPVAGTPTPDPDPPTLESLRQQLHRLADTRNVETALKSYLQELVNSLLTAHPQSLTANVSVTLYRGKDNLARLGWDWTGRLQEGDWVQYEDKNERLSKQI